MNRTTLLAVVALVLGLLLAAGGSMLLAHARAAVRSNAVRGDAIDDERHGRPTGATVAQYPAALAALLGFLITSVAGSMLCWRLLPVGSTTAVLAAIAGGVVLFAVLGACFARFADRIEARQLRAVPEEVHRPISPAPVRAALTAGPATSSAVTRSQSRGPAVRSAVDAPATRPTVDGPAPRPAADDPARYAPTSLVSVRPRRRTGTSDTGTTDSAPAPVSDPTGTGPTVGPYTGPVPLDGPLDGPMAPPRPTAAATPVRTENTPDRVVLHGPPPTTTTTTTADAEPRTIEGHTVDQGTGHETGGTVPHDTPNADVDGPPAEPDADPASTLRAGWVYHDDAGNFFLAIDTSADGPQLLALPAFTLVDGVGPTAPVGMLQQAGAAELAVLPSVADLLPDTEPIPGPSPEPGPEATPRTEDATGSDNGSTTDPDTPGPRSGPESGDDHEAFQAGSPTTTVETPDGHTDVTPAAPVRPTPANAPPDTPVPAPRAASDQDSGPAHPGDTPPPADRKGGAEATAAGGNVDTGSHPAEHHG